LLRGQSRLNYNPAIAGSLPHQELLFCLILDTCPGFNGIKKSGREKFLSLRTLRAQATIGSGRDNPEDPGLPQRLVGS